MDNTEEGESGCGRDYVSNRLKVSYLVLVVDNSSSCNQLLHNLCVSVSSSYPQRRCEETSLYKERKQTN